MSLAPDIRETIDISTAAIQYIVGKTTYNYNQVIGLIENILTETLEATINDLDLWIDMHVPKRTGQLRWFLKHNLRASSVELGIMRLKIGTNLEYAKRVAEMPTANVRHYNQMGYVYYTNIFGIRGKVRLNDPQAVGFFWNKLLEYAHERTEVNFIKAKNKYLVQGRYSQLIRTRLKIK